MCIRDSYCTERRARRARPLAPTLHARARCLACLLTRGALLPRRGQMEKISAVQDDINEVTDIMRHNIEKAVQRGEQLEMVSLRPGSVHPLRSRA